MDWIYQKIVGFFLGEALANSDRVKVVIAGFIGKALLTVAAGCAVCAALLTPEIVSQLTNLIAGAVVTLVAALTHRDVAAPGQTVPGAAVDIGPPPPLPDDPALVPPKP